MDSSTYQHIAGQMSVIRKSGKGSIAGIGNKVVNVAYAQDGTFEVWAVNGVEYDRHDQAVRAIARAAK